MGAYDVNKCLPLCFAIILVGLFVVFPLHFASASGPVTIFINNAPLHVTPPPYIENNVTMVPMRSIFQALDYEVHWDGTTRRITAVSGQRTIELRTDDRTAPGPQPIIRNDTTFVPLRWVSEQAGYNVHWEATSQTIVIESPANGTPPPNANANPAGERVERADVRPEPENSDVPDASVNSIEGKVLDSHGNPVAGATVRFMYNKGIPQDFQTVTGEDGSFRIDALHVSTDYIAAAFPPEEDRDHLYSQHYYFSHDGTHQVLPPLSLQPVQVRGKVVVGDASPHETFVDLYAVLPNGRHSKVFEYWTAADGEFRLTRLQEGKEYYIATAAPEGYAINSYRFVYRGVDPAPVLQYTKVHSASFRIVTEDGGPIDTSHLFLTIRRAGSQNPVAVGRFENGILRVPDLVPGSSYSATAAIAKGEAPYLPSDPLIFTFDPERTEPISIVMKQAAPYQLTGRLIGEGDVIFDDFIISVKDHANETFTRATSELERDALLSEIARSTIPTTNWGGNGGVYKLNRLQEGRQYTVTYQFGFEPVLSTALHVSPPNYTFTYSADMTELPTMVAPKVQVTGRVVSPSGTGLQPDSITLEDVQTGARYPARAGADGFYAIGGMEEGKTYRVSVMLPSVSIIQDNTRGFHHREMTFVYNRSLQQLDPIVIEPEARTTALMRARGKVVDPAGQPVGNISVFMRFSGDDGLRLVKTNEQGEYTFSFENAASGEVFLWGRDESIPLRIADRDILLPVLVYRPE